MNHISYRHISEFIGGEREKGLDEQFRTEFLDGATYLSSGMKPSNEYNPILHMENYIVRMQDTFIYLHRASTT